MNAKEYKLSVVIPTKDRPQRVAALYTNLLQQSRPPDEIVIIDQSRSSAGKISVEKIHDRFARNGTPVLNYLLDPMIRGAAHARNVGAEATSGELIVFIDDDLTLNAECLSRLEQALHSHPRLLAASGIVTNYSLPVWHARLVQRVLFLGLFYDERQNVYRKWSEYSVGERVTVKKLCGGCLAFRRVVFQKVGGFDQNYRGSSVGEDIEISQRLLCVYPDAEMAFIGGVWITNGDRGEWRRRDRREETIIVASHYLLKKNRNHGLKVALYFVWLTLGTILVAAAASLRCRHIEPIRSAARGIQSVISGYKGCDFLEAL